MGSDRTATAVCAGFSELLGFWRPLRCRAFSGSREIIVGTWRAARAEQDDITEVSPRRGRRCSSSTRFGTSSSRPSRRGSCSCWSSGSRCGWTALTSARARTVLSALVREVAGAESRRAAMNKQVTVSADGQTVTVHVPLTFRRRGGRNLISAHAGMARRGCCGRGSSNAMVEALARAFRWRKMLDTGVHATLEDLGRGPRAPRLLRQPRPPADFPRAGDRRGDPAWAATGGSCS